MIARSGCLTEEHLAHVREIQAQIGAAFNTALRGILLGKGSTMIFMFGSAFSYYTDRDAEGSKLEKVSNLDQCPCSLYWDSNGA